MLRGMLMRASLLLVEDDDDDATLIAQALSKSSRIELELARVDSMAAAQEHLRARRVDAVLLDLGLPDSEGLATFDGIQTHAGGAAVIVLTGDDREELGLLAVERGAQEYLVKTERAYQLLPLAIAYACERQRHNQEVKELTSALTNAFGAIATLDSRGVLVAANPAFQTLMSAAPTELVTTPLLDLVHETDRARVDEELRCSTLEELEANIVRKDGRIVPVQLSVVARAHGHGHFCFVRDLTRQKLVEGRLASGAGITAVGSLAVGLAHEINNPLAVVLANVEEAGRSASDLEPNVDAAVHDALAELKAMLEEALSAAQRVQYIVRDLRSFACMDDRRTRVNVNAVLESCSNIAFAEIRHRARLVKDLQTVSPVLGSEAKLAQAFLNLLVNAAQAIPEGNVEHNEIRLTTTPHRTGIVIEISDTGSGIAPADANQVFEPFFTTKPRRPGMGLAICRATVIEHGGDISIHAREGGKTVVRVVLPAIESETAYAPSEPRASASAAGPRRR